MSFNVDIVSYLKSLNYITENIKQRKKEFVRKDKWFQHDEDILG
jgi:hypothetical protein